MDGNIYTIQLGRGRGDVTGTSGQSDAGHGTRVKVREKMRGWTEPRRVL
jgi:hypothetical protein